MDDDDLTRLRERLAAGALPDDAFDRLFPVDVRSKSARHWTPISVARTAACRLVHHGASRVLDAGSGPGKFCTIAAGANPAVSFVGIEQRVGLVSVAREVAKRLGVINARFMLGDALARPWTKFDGFYFFNPFTENLWSAQDVFDARTGGPRRRFRTEALRVAQHLRQARRGSVVVTYHGLGGPIPSSYELKHEETCGTGHLRTWVKQRDHEEEWVHLEHRTVMRASWQSLRRESLQAKLRKTTAPGRLKLPGRNE
jgi:SAM-dependent methyltransferase